MQTNCPGGIILARGLMPCAALSTSGLSPNTSKISPGALSGEGVTLECHINESLELMCLYWQAGDFRDWKDTNEHLFHPSGSQGLAGWPRTMA